MRTLMVTVFGLSLIGCSSRIGDFTVASTKNINVLTGRHRVDSSKRLTGTDTAHMILIIPTGIPDLKEAMDNAIEQAPGAVGLSNVVIKRGAWSALLYGQNWVEVEGNPIYQEN